MNIIIPMAGEGSRFVKAGYTDPKPLIPVQGLPMIEVVVKNLGIKANYIFLVQREHNLKYGLRDYLQTVVPESRIVELDGLTEGAACTTLMAKELIDSNEPLMIANSDQFVEWDPQACVDKFKNYDAGIVTFRASDPKWSYAKLDDNGLVTQVAEKVVISDLATVGIYYWARGKDYVRCAEQMIHRNIRVNNEFYVCPVFNEAINAGLKVVTYDASNMWGLGTPEDLQYFLGNYAFDSTSWTS